MIEIVQLVFTLNARGPVPKVQGFAGVMGERLNKTFEDCNQKNLKAMASTLVASLLLVAMPFAPSSFLFLVVRPGAPSSVLAPSSVHHLHYF